ncbi:tyrosine-type recombinase/integrase [Xenorhabdus sp. PB61.4]|uniref:tyrosine-type recombinase/integrase n=1 Tax=Xenorhabdus sp. PB61.4 TaxID=2788940 RepID=UPI001E50AAD7|nr:tyrosine-type recombinase/integrase [Xenorhabdus sp. PB61.4]MCC8364958.1 tyrosine-type recombinase/integrase [Xenorhabdus sp. PB61.4]
MSRKRKNPADNWMPPRVRRGRSAFEFQTPDNRTVRLCDLSATQEEVLAAYEKTLIDEKGEEEKRDLSALINAFFRSADFKRLVPESRRDYYKYAKKVNSVFGKMEPDTIKPEHIRRYMDKRGLRSQTQANREKNFMSRVFGWGYERGLVTSNPCRGVRQFKEIPRDRYITDDEYNAIYSVSPLVVQIAMELAYLCCARQSDILGLTYAQVAEEGIYIKQGKTKVAQIKLWTERLYSAIEKSQHLPVEDGVTSIYVIHQRTGARYARDGFNSRWRKAKHTAKEKFPELDFNFTFHDLKAKGISDLEGTLQEKQRISGHKNIGQTARYNRKVASVPVVGGQKKPLSK